MIETKSLRKGNSTPSGEGIIFPNAEEGEVRRKMRVQTREGREEMEQK